MNKLVPTLGLFSALAFTSACGKNDLSDDEYDDVASSVSGLVSDEPSGDGEAAADATDAAQGRVPSALSVSTQGRFQGKRGAIDYVFDLTCKDASGSTILLCENATSADLAISWDGELETARRSLTIHREVDWKLTGLDTALATMNGTGSAHVEGDFMAIFRSDTRTFVFDYSAEYVDVKISTETKKIASGNATYHLTGDRTVSRNDKTSERHYDVTAEVKFLGNGQAELTLDGTKTYTITLQGGAVIRR